MKPINGLKTSREIYDYYASMQKTANYICKSINSALSYLENIQKQQSHQKTLEVFFYHILIAMPLSCVMIVNDPVRSLWSNFPAVNLIWTLNSIILQYKSTAYI